MNNLICRKDECDNVVECDVDTIAITCNECCATLGVDNNIAFGGQMENLVTAIVWFGNTVVICIAAIVIYCMINKGGKQYGIYNEVRINMADDWVVSHWNDWYRGIGQFVRMFDVVE